jgi:hypothetical protein
LAIEDYLTQPSTMKSGLQMLLLAVTWISADAMAQGFNIDWHSIAGGGGTSVGGNNSVGGTIGQHDASGPMSGGNYSLTGGFWSILAVQAPGAPNLVIQYISPNAVKVSWPNAAGYTLRQNDELTTSNWPASAYPVATASGTNSITISSPVGNLFFRLGSP